MPNSHFGGFSDFRRPIWERKNRKNENPLSRSFIPPQESTRMGPQGGGSRRFQDCHIEFAQRFRLRVHARVTMFAVSCTALPHFKSIAENTGDAIVMTPDNRYHVGVPVPVFRMNLCRRLPRPDFRLQAHYRILREPPPCGPILVTLTDPY